jgi:hypothetical protein
MDLRLMKERKKVVGRLIVLFVVNRIVGKVWGYKTDEIMVRLRTQTEGKHLHIYTTLMATRAGRDVTLTKDKWPPVHKALPSVASSYGHCERTVCANTMDVEVGERGKKAKPWYSSQKSPRTSWRSATLFSGCKVVAESRRSLGIYDGGEELGHTEAVEGSRRRFSPWIWRGLSRSEASIKIGTPLHAYLYGGG